MEQRPSESGIDPTVFYVSLVVVLAFVAWGQIEIKHTPVGEEHPDGLT